MTPENVSAIIDTVKGTVLPSERIAMFNKACAIDPHDTVVIEELSELIKAVSKINRCHNNKHLAHRKQKHVLIPVAHTEWRL